MTRIVRSLSVFCKSFSKCTFSFSYVLFLTSFAFYHINQGRVVRKPVNVNRGLNVTCSIIFSCLKMLNL